MNVELALTRNWNELSRVEQIAVRHRLHTDCDLPNDEYVASWDDVRILLERIAELEAEARQRGENERVKPMTGPYEDERLFERELDPPDTTDDDEARADEWDDFNDD